MALSSFCTTGACTLVLLIACLFAYSKRSFYGNFFLSNQKLYWKGKKSINKNEHIKQTFYIRLKRLTSAGVSIACKSCSTCAYVRSHIIATHSINVTTVRVGRTIVYIYGKKKKKGSKSSRKSCTGSCDQYGHIFLLLIPLN